MSWNGTVTCSGCYGEGHNKRSCPELQKRLEERAATGDSWAEERLRRSRSKTCGFCKNEYHKDDPESHNARTCSWRKHFEAITTANVIRARKKVIKQVDSYGCFRGALVIFETNEYTNDGYQQVEKMAMIEEIEWESINHQSIPDDEARYFNFPFMNVRHLGGDQHDKVGRVRMPPELFCPDDFFSGESDEFPASPERRRQQEQARSDSNSVRIVSPSIKNGEPPSSWLEPAKIAREHHVKNLIDNKKGYHDRQGPPPKF